MLLLLVYQDKQESPYFPFVSHIRHDRMEIHLPRKKNVNALVTAELLTSQSQDHE